MGKKREKSERQKVIEKLDSVFSDFIRLRDSDNKGRVVCPLCNAKMYRKYSQNMHFISRGVLKYRFDEKNCHAWCKRCNVFLNGNYIVYTRRMIENYGIELVDEMLVRKNEIYKIDTPDLEEMIKEYKEKVKILRESKSLLYD